MSYEKTEERESGNRDGGREEGERNRRKLKLGGNSEGNPVGRQQLRLSEADCD